MAWHDHTANTLNIRANNGTPSSISYSSGVLSGSADFALGARPDTLPNYLDGRVDAFGLWKRVLTSGERTSLYNSGAGCQYPLSQSCPTVVEPTSTPTPTKTPTPTPTATATTSPMLSRLVAYWKLDETSGTRDDAAGASDLTDNNTVGYAAGKISNAAQFTAANSEFVSHTDNASLSTGNIDFTLAGWVYANSGGADRPIRS